MFNGQGRRNGGPRRLAPPSAVGVYNAWVLLVEIVR
jgi:hypothetical protein